MTVEPGSTSFKESKSPTLGGNNTSTVASALVTFPTILPTTRL